MRLEKTDYILLAILGFSLLFGAFKLLMVDRADHSSPTVMPSPELPIAVNTLAPKSPEFPVIERAEDRPVLVDAAEDERRLEAALEEEVPLLSSAGRANDKLNSLLSSDFNSRLNWSSVRDYELVYSLQVGVFKTLVDAQRFARSSDGADLLCRKKDNGYWGVYYGAYQSFGEAKSHLRDQSLLERVGAYVVKLNRVSFQACALN